MQPLQSTKRISSIDILRGAIIILMGLDHVRDFVAPTPFNPLDVTVTTPAWFLTRWITHFCAPVFVFLAGTSAFIYGHKVGKQELSKFLWSRGAWLIIIEFTLVHFGWTFDFSFFFVQVIWVIGWSMILLAFLIHTPQWFIVAFTFVIIAGHNLLDPMQLDEYWWQFLHEPRWRPPIAVAYPLIPWPAVMSFGYLTGKLYIYEDATRKRRLILTGTLLLILFIVLRVINVYGDEQPWNIQPRGFLYTLLDMLDTTKYPPSLQYLCMTLGPAIILLALLENSRGKMADFLQTFGRVPFFYYVMHLYVIHSLSILYHGLRYDEWRTWLFGQAPAGYKPNLLTAYLGWTILTIIMYFLCRWFAGIKKKYSYWWLKYL